MGDQKALIRLVALAIWVMLLACSLPTTSGETIDGLKRYEIVDFEIESLKRRLAQGDELDRTISLPLRVLGRQLSFELTRSDRLFSARYRHYIIGKDRQVEREEPALNCIYNGRDAEQHDIVISVSLCDDRMHAYIDNATDASQGFSVQPHRMADGTESHIAYFHRELSSDNPRVCGVTEEVEETYASTVQAMLSNARLQLAPDSLSRKYIGVSVINDYRRFLQKGISVHYHSAALIATANLLFAKLGTSTAPSSIAVQLEIVSMYTFSNGDPWKHSASEPESIENVPEDVNGEVSANNLLSAANNWRRYNVLPLQNMTAVNGHDIAHILTGYTFQKNTIGLAQVHGVCEAIFRSGVTQAFRMTDAQIASTITHEIGHNLGMLHTDTPPSPELASSCKDTADSRFIMSKISTTVANTNWDPCSIEYLKQHFDPQNGRYPGLNQGTYSACAEVPSDGFWVPDIGVCGDGLVQPGEECDCLGKDCTGIDPCCNGKNCTLKAGAACSAQDSCCVATTCQIQNNTQTVCRQASTFCDVEERCNGQSPKCPFDTFKATGTACKTPRFNKDGTCYWKECVDAAEECILRGLDQTSEYRWDDTCSSETTGFFAYPLSSSCSVRCRRPAPSFVCDSYAMEQFYADGVQCDTGMGCYNRVCTPFALIPVPISPSCSNYRVDPDEVDMDCGGACFGCEPGKYCSQDVDCIYPGTCEKKELITFNGRSNLGRCLAPPPAPFTLRDAYYYIREWFKNNPFIWGPILAIIILGLLLCGVYCRRRRRRSKAALDAALSNADFKSGDAEIGEHLKDRAVYNREWHEANHVTGLDPTAEPREASITKRSLYLA